MTPKLKNQSLILKGFFIFCVMANSSHDAKDEKFVFHDAEREIFRRHLQNGAVVACELFRYVIHAEIVDTFRADVLLRASTLLRRLRL
jgi:hypothetical protein